eukprot:CAMPEP_0119290212 /NCGR_PEP_ID=MMETSP1329-20130426/40379_1 /TAXON_ID=114041 /ORGANISM="Genus nov. species nov., Strain RCC1024" /LENGTH=210 /DNA_ID=CAMNT_0007291027 /DNA_START=4 /DNA_END=636 /DNA_ORIENTATION=+
MTTAVTVPHLVYTDDYELTALERTRKALGTSALPLWVKACSAALAQYPDLNASVGDAAGGPCLVPNASHDIGVAMDTPGGLVVPVVRDVASKTVPEVAAELVRLREAALGGGLAPRDIGHASFTLSNIGAIGGGYMSPVVTPPQVAVGAVGRARRVPRFVGDSDEVYAALVTPVSWAADHRFVDGATVARFSNLLKDLLEDPANFLAHLK